MFWDKCKRSWQLWLMTLLFVPVLGCNSYQSGVNHAKSYAVDRARDFGDTFVGTLGYGVGPKVQAGPFHAGLQVHWDSVGWRYGPVIAPEGEEVMGAAGIEATIGTIESCLNSPERGKRFEAIGGIGDRWVLFDFEREERGKNISHYFPILSVVHRTDGNREPLFHPYYTQVDASLGIIYSSRIGVNPGEVVDFILGWIGVDFFDDDIGLYATAENNMQEDEATK